MIRLYILILVAMAPGMSVAQTIVPVYEEPMHRLVFESSDLRILDVQIHPSDTTAFHRHEAAIAFVAISVSPVNVQASGTTWGTVDSTSAPDWYVGEVYFEESWVEAPVVHRVTNVGRSLFRLIGVMQRGAGSPEDGQPSMGSVGDIDQGGRWFRSAKRVVGSTQALDWAGVDRPVVVIQLSDGIVSIETAGAAPQAVNGAGAFGILESGRAYALHNRSSDPVELVLVEVR